jgi:serine/threonine protein kinase
MLELLERIRADQQDRWAAGDRVLAETYLEDNPTLREQVEAAIDLIYSEILVRERLGEVVSLEEYQRRFPDFAELLTKQMQLHELLRPDMLREDSEDQATSRYSLPSSNSAKADSLATLPGGGKATWPLIAGFIIEGKLGSGGSGEVYLAHQLNLGRRVAIKVLHEAGPDERALFQREAEAVASLKHPNIVPIFEFGECDGQPYIVMEYAERGSLYQQVHDSPLPWREAAALVAVLAEAVQAVHRRGIVHRDLKSGNILIGADGVPKIGDFGLAKVLGAEVSLIPAGAVVGSPAYMSPEQALGQSKEVNFTSDVYSLGAILYDALTGRPPFRGSPMEVLEQVCNDKPEPPRNAIPDIPLDLQKVCLKCLEKDPQDRYSSAQALADDLRRILANVPIPQQSWPSRLLRGARRRPVAASSTLTLAIALFVGSMWWAGWHPTPTPPVDPVKAMQDTLARTGSYTFVGGESNVPHWYQWRTVGGGVLPEAGGGFRLQSHDPCLMELLPEVPADHYLFRAQVRHDEARKLGVVGIYFGLKGRDDPNGEILGFCSLTFDDCEVWHRPPPPGLAPGNELLLNVCFVRTSPSFSHCYQPANALITFPAACQPPGKKNPWRQLAVEITPATVSFFWEGNKVGELTHESLNKGIHDALAGKLGEIDLSIAPHGGVGLFIESGNATFKEIHINRVIER